MVISEDKKNKIKREMKSLQIYEVDILEKFILGSGKGGQKVNKTSSCVYIKHIPTGIEIKCQKERCRETNRYTARKMLCEIIKEKIFKIKSERTNLIEKIRRQKQRKTRKQKQKMIEEKKHISVKKSFRKEPSDHY